MEAERFSLLFIKDHMTFQGTICGGGNSGNPGFMERSGTERGYGKKYYELHFIASTQVDCTFNDRGVSIYTKVTNREILNWIHNKTDTYPLLMVVGGYSGNKRLNDYELVTSNSNGHCKVKGGKVGDAGLEGAVGIYYNDAPYICGGRISRKNVLKTCWAYKNNG